MALSLIIIVHEAGHFFMARLFKIKVDKFSLGIGPALFKWKWFGTQFQISPFLFGGFVMMPGMLPGDEVDSSDPDLYPNKPAWQRFLVIFAGPATNIAIAMILGVIYFSTWGATQRPVITKTVEGSPADGLFLPGDIIRAHNGTPVFYMYEGWRPQTSLIDMVTKTGPIPQSVLVERDGALKVVTVTPKPDVVKDDAGVEHPVLRMGIVFADTANDSDWRANVKTAIAYPFQSSKMTLRLLWDKISNFQKPPLEGPPKMIDRLQKSIKNGWQTTLQLLIMLNIAIGLFNLLPVPALDGGRLSFLTYELITRKRPNQRIEMYVHMVGFVFLIALVISVSIGDCRAIFN